MRMIPQPMIRWLLLGGLHLLWWAAGVSALVVAFYSHAWGYDVYVLPCEGESCRSFFQLTGPQFGELGRVGLTPELYAGMTVALTTIQNLSFFAVGFLLYRYGWKDRYSLIASLLLIVTGTIFSTDDALFGSRPDLAETFRILNEFGSMYLFFLFLFPEGRFEPRWTAVPAVVWLIPMSCSFWLAEGSVLDLMTWPAPVKGVYMLVMHGLVLVSMAVRYRTMAAPEQRRHIRWFAVGYTGYISGGVLGLLEMFSDSGFLRMLTQVLMYAGLLFLPFSIGISVLENRLQRMAAAFNRTLVYAALSVLFILLYALAVGLFGLVLQGQLNTVAALLVTGLVAILFHPLRARVQRAVNHLVFGEREDPYAVLSGLGERLEASLTQKTLLTAVVESTAHALKLPYASVEMDTADGGVRTLAVFGAEGAGGGSEIPLTVQGEVVGRLRLGTPRLGDVLPPGKHPLLGDLIRQISIAVQAVRLTEELHRSRERLVNAREEERRRLRRDLHDGLGSGLASLTLRLDHAVQLLEDEPDQAKSLLGDVQTQLGGAIADIRRLVYALRPPALDEFGLGFALQELAVQYEHTPLRIAFELPPRLPALHAAAEVAVYRIVQEAVTNAVRHAGASECRVRLWAGGGELRLEVRDNGQGMPDPGGMTAGIGISSMKERSEELGGTCTIVSKRGEGTTVSAALPLEGEEYSHAVS